LHHPRARAEDLRHDGVCEQVDIAFAVALFDVLEPVPLGGRWEECLAEVIVATGAERECAGSRADEGAFDQYVVGEVEELEKCSISLAQAIGADEGLRVAMRSANYEKRAALGDDATEKGEMRRVVTELVFERKLRARRLV